MSIGLVTIAALLLLLPGVGFIAGVNFADKNVREIVFRNTPAEIGYVILVSAIIHLIFLPIPHLNVADLYVKYHNTESTKGQLSSNHVRALFAFGLFYFMASSALGFWPGWLLGKRVQREGKWRFFAKHRWMLELAGANEKNVVYARVLLKHKFSIKEMDSEADEYMVGIEGILRDSYFDSNGTLLYLVFRSFTELKIPLATPPYVATFIPVGQKVATADSGQLMVEGDEIVMARYFRLSTETPEAPESLDMIAQAVAEG